MTMLAQPRSRFWDILDAGTLREMGLTLLMVSLVLFVSAMTLLGANVSELRQGYARVQQSNEALLELAAIDADILRLEMTVRGYVLSGEPSYLVWKQMGASTLDDRVARFDSVFRNNPVQMGNVKTLRRLLNEHRVFFDDLTLRASSDHARVVADIIGYSKRVGRRSIEDHLLVMRANEMKSLAQQQVLAETRVVRAYSYAIGISAAALLFASLGFVFLVHDRRKSWRRGA